MDFNNNHHNNNFSVYNIIIIHILINKSSIIPKSVCLFVVFTLHLFNFSLHLSVCYPLPICHSHTLVSFSHLFHILFAKTIWLNSLFTIRVLNFMQHTHSTKIQNNRNILVEFEIIFDDALGLFSGINLTDWACCWIHSAIHGLKVFIVISAQLCKK